MSTDRELPKWKRVDCPACKQKAGDSCGRYARDVPWVWITTSPHEARRAAAALAPTPKEKAE